MGVHTVRPTTGRLVVALALIAAVTVVGAERVAAATTITVTEDADENNSDGDCSLREAIIAANTDAARDACPAGTDPDTIVVPADTYDLAIGGQGEDASATGDLDITEDLTISGGGATTTIIDGNDLDRVIDVVSGTVEISDVTIQDGSVTATTATADQGWGGGVFVAGDLTLTDAIVTENRNVGTCGDQGAVGGGITTVAGTLEIVRSIVSGNAATTACSTGAGIGSSGGTVTLTDSTVSGNTADANQGGLDLNGSVNTLTNTTVSGNSAPTSGGINQGNGGSLTLTNSTITDNTGGLAGGLLASGATISNTIIANNNSGPDCFVGQSSAGPNLDSDSSCFSGGSDVHADPLLGPLSYNGGATKTHALTAGSPAIDVGTNSGCPSADQRGAARPFDAPETGGLLCDIGAYEVSPLTFTPTRPDDPAPDGCAPTDCSLREATIAANQDSAADTIDLPASTYDLTIAGAGENQSLLGDLDLTEDVFITGAGQATTIIDAGGSGGLGDRVLDVDNVTALVSDVTITGGDIGGDFAGGISAISANLTLTDSTITGNRADSFGGGILTLGNLTLTSSTVSGNESSGNMGGGLLGLFSTIVATDSTISGNSATAGGGMNLLASSTTITGSTLSTNTVSDDGGAIFVDDGTLDVTDSTVSGNTAVDQGGGIWTDNGGTMTNTTVTDNTAPAGAGVWHDGSPPPDSKNSIVVSNTGPDCNSLLTSTGPNLGSPASTCYGGGSDLLSATPGLGALTDNGGPTETHALLPGSPALDNGTNTGCPDFDQRGLDRPIDADGSGGATCDIGAYEANAIVINDQTTEEGANQTFTVTLATADPDEVKVNFATTPGSAVNPTDYLTKSGTLTFASGDVSEQTTITGVEDAIDEVDETYTVVLSSPVNAVIRDASGLGTILDDDPLTSITVDDATVVEGNGPGTTDVIVTVRLNGETAKTVTVDWETQDAEATSPADYVAASGPLTFTPGVTTQPVTLTVNGDLLVEPDEPFHIVLSNPTNATLGDDTGDVTILTDDGTSTPSPGPSPSPSPSPTGGPGPIDGCNPAQGDICGTDGDDDITIDSSSDPDGDGFVEVHLGDGNDTVCIEEGSDLTVTVIGGDGDDTLNVGNCSTARSSSSAAASEPTVIFKGGGGNDSATAGDGDDTLKGGKGDDTLLGKKGDDTLRGVGGSDTLKGGKGEDTAYGGVGSDTCKAEHKFGCE